MGGQHLQVIHAKKKSCDVPLSYVIIEDTPGPKKSKNRDAKTIYQESIVMNKFNKDSRKVLYIFKELTLGTDAETWIKGTKCVRKAMQEIQAHYDIKS